MQTFSWLRLRRFSTLALLDFVAEVPPDTYIDQIGFFEAAKKVILGAFK
jgi:hypothetical protein